MANEETNTRENGGAGSEAQGDTYLEGLSDRFDGEVLMIAGYLEQTAQWLREELNEVGEWRGMLTELRRKVEAHLSAQIGDAMTTLKRIEAREAELMKLARKQ